jgi:hypothetical protein
MAIAYNPVNIKGVAYEPILEEIIFENGTIKKSLVTFETDVKAETIFTEASATATLQQYVSGAPTSAGSLSAFDVVVTPDKGMFYQEFDPNSIRFSRFKRDMPAGTWNNTSSEFERILIGGVYSKKMSNALENLFWSGVKESTQTAVAALTAGTAQNQVGAKEKTLVASLTPTAGTLQLDGIVAKMIYNSSNPTNTAGVGGRVKVVGTTLTSANVKSEFDKIYEAIPAEVLAGAEKPIIYAPKNVKQMIVAANNVTTDFKKPFDVNPAATEFYFNGLLTEFVPVPNNVVIVALKSHLFWVTDLASDNNTLKIEKIANNREDMFIKSVMTIGAHVGNQKFNVLYVG